VLHQQAKRNLKCECHLSSLQASSGTVGELSESIRQIENYDSIRKSSITSAQSMPLPSQHNNHIHHHHHQQQQHVNIKKQGVSGESCDASFTGHSSDILIRKYDKDFK
jgi:hypothetical protein